MKLNEARKKGAQSLLALTIIAVCVYLGFKPAWVMIKPSTFASNWIIMDSSRGSFNPDLGWLYPDGNFEEEAGSSRYCDFLSNGFKSNTNSQNEPGSTYIYMAFAEQPYEFANAR